MIKVPELDIDDVKELADSVDSYRWVQNRHRVMETMLRGIYAMSVMLGIRNKSSFRYMTDTAFRVVLLRKQRGPIEWLIRFILAIVGSLIGLALVVVTLFGAWVVLTILIDPYGFASEVQFTLSWADSRFPADFVGIPPPVGPVVASLLEPLVDLGRWGSAAVATAIIGSWLLFSAVVKFYRGVGERMYGAKVDRLLLELGPMAGIEYFVENPANDGSQLDIGSFLESICEEINACTGMRIDFEDLKLDLDRAEGGGNAYVGWGSGGAFATGLFLSAMSSSNAAAKNKKINDKLEFIEHAYLYGQIAKIFNEIRYTDTMLARISASAAQPELLAALA